MPSSKLMSLQHRLEAQTKHTSLLPIVYKKGDRRAWGDMMCHIVWYSPPTSLITSPFLSFTAPLSLSLSWISHFDSTCLLFLSEPIQGERAYCQGQRQITATAQCFFFCAVNVLQRERRKEAVGRERNGRHGETELIRLISRQKTVGGEINGTRQQNGGSGLCKRADVGANVVYRNKLRLAKVRNEQQKTCEIVTQLAVDARNSGGVHVENRAETFVTHSCTPRTRRFSLTVSSTNPRCRFIGWLCSSWATANRRVKPTGS